MDSSLLKPPKTLLENLKFRKYIRAEAVKSRKVRDALRHVCATDILFFLNAFGLDPLIKSSRPKEPPL